MVEDEIEARAEDEAGGGDERGDGDEARRDGPGEERAAAPPDAREGLAAVGEVMLQRMGAVRMEFTWWGAMRALSREQNEIAAQAFRAEGKEVSGRKKLADMDHPALVALRRERSRIKAYIERVSLDFPMRGVRLVRVQDVADVSRELALGQRRVREGAVEADRCLPAIIEMARDRLGDLFHEGDYPRTLIGAFDLDYDFPPLAPPDYLMDQAPHIYARERERIRVQLESAARDAEEKFTEEFANLVGRITKGLSGGDVGDKPKTFHEGAGERLREFFERFRQLDMGFDGRIGALIDEAEQAISGINYAKSRRDETLRERVRKDLEGVGDALAEMMVDRPRVRVSRRDISAAFDVRDEG